MILYSDQIQWKWIAIASALDGLAVAFFGGLSPLSSAGIGLAIGWGAGLLIGTVFVSFIPIYLYKLFKKSEMPGIPSFVWTLWAILAFFMTLQEIRYM